MLSFSRLFSYWLLASSFIHAQVYHGSLDVVQNDTGNTSSSITLTLESGSSGDVAIDTSTSSRGDYFIDFPTVTSPIIEGALITSVSENGRDFGLGDGVEYGISSAAVGGSQYFIAMHEAELGSVVEINLNAAFAWFDFDEFLGARVYNSTNNGPLTSLVGSTGIDLGEEFIDSASTDGIYDVDLTTVDANATSANGLLLVAGAKNENNYAISQANADGTFTIFCRDVQIEEDEFGDPVFENEPVSFVYVPFNASAEEIVCMGRISDAVSTSDYTVTTDSAGTWYLEVPGYDANAGTLIISPECEDAAPGNRNNLISYEWDDANSRWVIETRDNNLTLEDTSGSATFSFIFLRPPPLVVQNANDSGPGSLAQAITDVGPGGSIIFDASLDGSVINNLSVTISKNLTIDASSLPNGLTIAAFTSDGNNLTINSGSSVNIRGLDFTGNSLGNDGVGIAVNAGAALTVEDCYFSILSANNVIYVGEGGLLTVRNSQFDGCYSTQGAAVEVAGQATAVIQQSSFISSSSAYAITIGSETTLKMTNCRISGTLGGGVLGGDDCDIQLTNCLVSGNAGDAVRQSGIATLLNCTVAGNSGSGIISSGGGTAALKNTIISLNGDAYSYPADPEFVAPRSPAAAPTTNGNYRLKSTSVAINTGDGAAGASENDETVDLDGRPRFVEVIDLGAYEMPAEYKVENLDDDSLYSLRYLLDYHREIQVIEFDPSLDGGVIALTGPTLAVSTSRTIDASALPNGITIERQENGDHVPMMTTTAYETTLRGLTFSNGIADYGGAIRAQAGTLHIESCRFINNEANLDGGAIYSNATLNLNSCFFDSNTAETRGGAAFQGVEDIIWQDSVFLNNSAEQGGAIYIYSYDLVQIQNCQFRGNSATDGAVFHWDDYGTSELSSGILGNCLIAGNSGGSLISFNQRLNLVNCTIAGNASGLTNGDLRLYNTVYWGNGASLPSYLGSNNLVEGTDADPLFVDPIASGSAPTILGDYHLQAESPAINAGNYSNYTTYTNETEDLDGGSRLNGPNIDIGAYEDQSAFLVVYYPLFYFLEPETEIYLGNYPLTGDESVTFFVSNAGHEDLTLTELIVSDTLNLPSPAFSATELGFEEIAEVAIQPKDTSEVGIFTGSFTVMADGQPDITINVRWGVYAEECDVDADGVNEPCDTDLDGLNDLQELEYYFTHPAIWDTDEDGVGDGDEVNLASLGLSNGVDDSALVASLQQLIGNYGAAIDLYDRNGLQNLAMSPTMLERDADTGKFTLTLGLLQSDDLIEFTPMTGFTPTYDAATGEVFLEFSPPSNDVFFFQVFGGPKPTEATQAP